MDAIEKTSRLEEKSAVEKAVAHVEKIRQKKLEVHNRALEEVQKVKAAAQVQHDAINVETKKKTDAIITKATESIKKLA